MAVLERLCIFTGTVGSNPTPSAKVFLIKLITEPRDSGVKAKMKVSPKGQTSSTKKYEIHIVRITRDAGHLSSEQKQSHP